MIWKLTRMIASHSIHMLIKKKLTLGSLCFSSQISVIQRTQIMEWLVNIHTTTTKKSSLCLRPQKRIAWIVQEEPKFASRLPNQVRTLDFSRPVLLGHRLKRHQLLLHVNLNTGALGIIESVSDVDVVKHNNAVSKDQGENQSDEKTRPNARTEESNAVISMGKTIIGDVKRLHLKQQEANVNLFEKNICGTSHFRRIYKEGAINFDESSRYSTTKI